MRLGVVQEDYGAEAESFVNVLKGIALFRSSYE